MLSLLLPILDLLLLALLVGLLSRSALAQELPAFWSDPVFFAHQPDHAALAVDLLAFSQWDHGGDPLVDEGFRYEAISVEAKLKAADRVYPRGAAVVAYLQNNPLITLPSSIVNAHVSSASTDFVTLDALLAVDITSADDKWRISPGAFYHHQWAYIAGGLDLDVRRVFAGGDTTLRLAWAGRYAMLHQVHWDGTPVNDDTRITNNFIFSWTQVISPTVITQLGLQYTHQSGLLNSTLNFVGLYNSAGEPVQLVDEVLPRIRNRGQISLRTRYAPSVGTGYGLDMSVYYDDWALLNVALEPNLEVPIGGSRLRFWYLLADQKATKYFTPNPLTVETYMTQNSNLGSFFLMSPGMLLLVPLNPLPAPRWMLRAAVLGFYRTDRIYGVGGSLGVSVEW
jgi:hypothetical protein